MVYLVLVTLIEEMKQNVVSEVTKEEIYSIVKAMAHNKSPHHDGFTFEFFITS